MAGRFVRPEKPSAPNAAQNPPDNSDSLIYGINSVREALAAGRRIRRLYIAEGHTGTARRAVGEILELAGKAGVRADVMPRGAFMRKCPHQSAQGVAAEVWTKTPVSLDELLEIPARRGEPPFFILVDGVEDPRNLGAIFRSAEVAGVHGIVVTERRCAPVGATVAKTSAGAVEHMDFAVVTNIKRAIEAMREAGIAIFAAEADGNMPPWKVDLAGPVALLLGSEGQGVRPTVRAACDGVISIPQRGHVNSLNVSVSAGMLLYEALRQRLGRSNHAGS